VCEGTADEKLEWFKVINLAGEPLTEQELLNANFTGPWLSSAKLYFMKSNSPGYGLGSKYVEIEANQSRGRGLETAIKWIANNNVRQYMADHQNDANADPLWQHFRRVIEWLESIFIEYHSTMKGIDWGRLYVEYSSGRYDSSDVARRVRELNSDPFVRNKKGIFEFILGNEEQKRLLDIRVFEEHDTRTVYTKQTESATSKGISNCPLCVIENMSNRDRIWDLEEMDADHVAAWSKGGATSIENCQMLCKTHNRAKGNR
jgi:hypothetical protein